MRLDSAGRHCCVLVMLAPLGLGLLAGCGAGSSPAGGQRLNVVAAENVWGSVAAQLGGSHVAVTSIVTDPNADPHEYANNTNDARAVADADYVLLNGAGYDSWGEKLLDANPSSSRLVTTAANVVGRRQGDNPHLWYDPGAVERIADRVSADYKRLDPADSADFDRLRAGFHAALRPYRERIAAIAASFAGRRIAATEDVVVDLARALRLEVISPPAFMQAVAEGNDPPASAVATFQGQLGSGEASVLVVNVQATSAVTTAMRDLAREHGIPVVEVSETLQPPGASFQAWQLAELASLERALDATRNRT